MRIYQVHRCKGYTLIELLVVILILGVFFYLALPVFKNILPEEENKNILKLIEIIEKASKEAIEKQQKIILAVDIDTHSCSVMTEEKVSGEAEENNGEEADSFEELPLIFVRAQNSSKEVTSGLITFLFFPDGSKEFGALLVKDMDEEETYTIFLNPYTISPAAIKGEVNFEEEFL